MSYTCPKCGSCNITFKEAELESFGMETVKGVAQAGYWGFKVVAKLTDNLGIPLASPIVSGITRGIASAIKSGADAIPTTVRKCHCNKCGHNWGRQISKS